MSGRANRAARSYGILCAVTLAAALFAMGAGGEEARIVPLAGAPLQIDHAESASVQFLDGEEVWAVTGNVVARYEDTEFRADAVIYWPDTQEAYAEGNILLTRKEITVTADRTYFSTDRGGFIENGTMSFRPRGMEVAVFVHGSTITVVSENEYEIENGWITTCGFTRPHYRVQARRVRLYRRSPDEPWRVSARDNAFFIGPMPVLYFPYYAGNVGRSLVRSVQAGSSSRFEGTVRSDLRLYQNEWLDAGVNIDFLEKRGIGAGIAAEMEGDDWRGALDTYYIHDHGTDTGGLVPPHADRGRAHFRHRQSLAEDWQVDAEFHYVSDRSFLREYFEDEFYEEKAPESYLYIKRTDESWAFSSLLKERVNDFQTETDYLPQLRGRLVKKPLLDSRIYLDSDWQVANVARRFDRDMPLSGVDAMADGREIWRFDANNELTSPFSAGPVTIIPSIGLRYSAFEEVLEREEAADRFVGSCGVSFSSQLSRVFAFESELLQIKKIRHIFFPEIKYRNVYEITTDPGELIPFDEVEDVPMGESVELRMRHVLETKRGAAGGEAPVEFLMLDLSSFFFPDAARDNAGKDFSPIEGDLVWRPREVADVLARWLYDPYEGEMDRASLAFRLMPEAPWSLYADYRFVAGVSSTSTASLGYKLTPKWKLDLYSQYDFRENESAGYKVGFSRDLHMWVLETSFGFDRGSDDMSFAINLWPKGLFGRPVGF